MLDFSDSFDPGLSAIPQYAEWKKFAEKYGGKLDPSNLLLFIFINGSISIPLQARTLLFKNQPTWIRARRMTVVSLPYAPLSDFLFAIEKKGSIAKLGRWLNLPLQRPDSSVHLVSNFSSSSILDKSVQCISNDAQKCAELFSDSKLLEVMEQAPDLLPSIDTSSYKKKQTFDLRLEIPDILANQEKLEFIHNYFLVLMTVMQEHGLC